MLLVLFLRRHNNLGSLFVNNKKVINAPKAAACPEKASP